MRYAPERLYEEIAYVAYHFSWSFDEIADMEHPLRKRFVDEIAKINRRLSAGPSEADQWAAAGFKIFGGA